MIVGVLEWKSGLTSYPKRHRKDQELRDVLVQRGTPAENIALLLDSDATLPKIRAAIANALNTSEKGSTLIVYYAGHGSPVDKDFCFANYDIEPGRKETAWSMNELGATLAKDFKGRRAIFWADCCYSGGLELAVDALAAKKIPACSLTSASTANSSTQNWTFTQSIIDGLRGEPLVDLNGDGKITLGELHAEVDGAMRNLEAQQDGFKASGIDNDFVLARASAARAKGPKGAFPLGSYVLAGGRMGRVVGAEGEKYAVQFYDYSDKTCEKVAAKDLVASTRKVGDLFIRLDAGAKPDCLVKWSGGWFDATVLKKEDNRWFIHYLGDDNSWDEWVGSERIRFISNKPPADVAKPDCQVSWNGGWYDATVLKSEAKRWFIHYTNDDSSWDEWVGPERIRYLTPKPADAPAPKSDCQVKWNGAWYDAAALKKDDKRWFIHYTGDDNSWDEWVGPDRIRFKK